MTRASTNGKRSSNEPKRWHRVSFCSLTQGMTSRVAARVVTRFIRARSLKLDIDPSQVAKLKQMGDEDALYAGALMLKNRILADKFEAQDLPRRPVKRLARRCQKGSEPRKLRTI